MSLLLYAYSPFVVYTCLQSTYPFSTKLPYESLIVLTSLYELPAGWVQRPHELPSYTAMLFQPKGIHV